MTVSFQSSFYPLSRQWIIADVGLFDQLVLDKILETVPLNDLYTIKFIGSAMQPTIFNDFVTYFGEQVNAETATKNIEEETVNTGNANVTESGNSGCFKIPMPSCCK